MCKSTEIKERRRILLDFLSIMSNRRSTYKHSIARALEFVNSNFLMEATTAELEIRLKMVEQQFIDFTCEHNDIVSRIPMEQMEQLKKQKEYYAQVELMYIKAGAGLKRIIDQREQLAQLDKENRERFGMNMTQNDSAMSRFTSRTKPAVASTSGVQEKIHVEQENRSAESAVIERFRAVGINTSSDEELEPSSRVEKVPSTVHITNVLAHHDLRKKLKRKAVDNDPIEGIERNERGPLPRVQKISCFNCDEPHPLFKCTLFLQMNIDERRYRIRELQLCDNCFSPLVNKYNNSHHCRAGECKRCNRGEYHNSLLCRGYSRK